MNNRTTKIYQRALVGTILKCFNLYTFPKFSASWNTMRQNSVSTRLKLFQVFKQEFCTSERSEFHSSKSRNFAPLPVIANQTKLQVYPINKHTEVAAGSSWEGRLVWSSTSWFHMHPSCLWTSPTHILIWIQAPQKCLLHHWSDPAKYEWKKVKICKIATSQWSDQEIFCTWEILIADSFLL